MKVIALGMGMQSTALYLMSSMRLFERADVAIFADPCAEHDNTYKIKDWLLDWSKQCADAIPIEIVKTNIKDDIIGNDNKKSKSFVSLPTYVINKNGEKGMVSRRQCTMDYKIKPLERKVREIMGLKKFQRWKDCEFWMGITIDEAQRMKDNYNKKIKNRYPLIEMMMSRNDCKQFMEKNNFPIPPKSACVFCPFHSDKDWIKLKKENGNAWKLIKEVDRSLRSKINPNGKMYKQYLHKDCKPIEKIYFKDQDQIDMFGNECEGHCGI